MYVMGASSIKSIIFSGRHFLRHYVIVIQYLGIGPNFGTRAKMSLSDHTIQCIVLRAQKTLALSIRQLLSHMCCYFRSEMVCTNACTNHLHYI